MSATIRVEIIPVNSASAAVALAARLVEAGVQFSVAPHPNNRENNSGVRGWQFSWAEPDAEPQQEVA